MVRKRSHITIDQLAATSCDEKQTESLLVCNNNNNNNSSKAAKVESMIKSAISTAGGNSLEVSSLPVRIFKHIENIRAMRASHTAPVDLMGCDKLHDKNADEKTQRYQILLALMLSSQTKDQVTHDAMQRLCQHGCTIENVLLTPEEKVGELIKPVGMWRKKANFIKRTTQILQDKFNSDIPGDLEGLCSLPGVGPKMSFLALQCGWGITAGIAVDTHVHRIANRLDWVDKPTKQPEQTRTKLESLFPK